MSLNPCVLPRSSVPLGTLDRVVLTLLTHGRPRRGTLGLLDEPDNSIVVPAAPIDNAELAAVAVVEQVKVVAH